MSYYSYNISLGINLVDLLDFFEAIPSDDRNDGIWILHDTEYLKMQSLTDANGYRFWHDDGSEFGRFLSLPVKIDNLAIDAIGIITPMSFVEHSSIHLYLYKNLQELIEDATEQNVLEVDMLLSRFTKWAHEQTIEPSGDNLLLHKQYNR